MLRIAKNRGATLVNHGSETEAHLLLPQADWDSHLSELLAEHFGQVDYSIAHGKNWTHALSNTDTQKVKATLPAAVQLQS